MRRSILTLLSAFLAMVLSVSIALSVNAQATSDQYAAEGSVQPGSTTQEPGSEASALEASNTDGSISQGSLPGAHASAEEISAMVPSEPYSQVVDNATRGRFQAPGWQSESSNPDGYGEDYAVAKPSERTKSAKFKVSIPADDYYTVYAWWPAEADNNAATRFGISTVSGVEWTKVDQRRDNGFWVRIDAYKMEAGDRVVHVAPRPGSEGYAVADAVQVVRGTQVAPPDASYEEPAAGEGEFTTASTRRERIQIMRVARNHLGTPYRRSPPHLCRAFRMEDCSCHTRLVFRRFGVGLPDHPAWQWRFGRKVARSNLRVGDLVFFKERGRRGPITHVGIYSGRGRLIHASRYYGRVVESRMRYINGYFGAKRVNARHPL